MKEKNRILLCTDLDRTLLPNGNVPESELARPAFRHIVEREEVVLVYVTGRDVALTEQAITEYELPEPDFLVCDVGTGIYHRNGNRWMVFDTWERTINTDWHGQTASELARKIPALPHLQLQDPSRIKKHKLSYHASPSDTARNDLAVLEKHLSSLNIKYRCVYSIDETIDDALVDVLPASAGKLGAIDFLARQTDVPAEQVYFSGDSGNDRDVLLSDYNTAVVANASAKFKHTILHEASEKNRTSQIYLADGSLNSSLNGNYAAGIVEGFVHYFPFAASWVDWEKLHEHVHK